MEYYDVTSTPGCVSWGNKTKPGENTCCQLQSWGHLSLPEQEWEQGLQPLGSEDFLPASGGADLNANNAITG